VTACRAVAVACTPVVKACALGRPRAGGWARGQLRALRLLCRGHDSHSDGVYLTHLDLIARAQGPGGRLPRLVKIADLQDRCQRPRVRADGWSPPYQRGLALLTDRGADTAAATV
jgi:hypothetical protein